MTEMFPSEELSVAYDKMANWNVRFKAVIEPIRKLVSGSVGFVPISVLKVGFLICVRTIKL